MRKKFYFVKISERQKNNLMFLKEKYKINMSDLVLIALQRISENSEKYFVKLKNFLFNTFNLYSKERRYIKFSIRCKNPQIGEITKKFLNFLSEQSYCLDEVKVISKLPLKNPKRFRKDHPFFLRLVIDYLSAYPEEFFETREDLTYLKINIG